MTLSQLTAISPVDGRYAGKLEDLRTITSEFGLIRRRVQVEIQWLRHLAAEPGIEEVPPLSPEAQGFLENLLEAFGEADAARVRRDAPIRHSGPHQRRMVASEMRAKTCSCWAGGRR